MGGAHDEDFPPKWALQNPNFLTTYTRHMKIFRVGKYEQNTKFGGPKIGGLPSNKAIKIFNF